MCGSRFKRDVQAWGFTCDIVQGEQGLLSLGAQCNLIVCATTSTTPILHARHIKEGTHVTAMGADCHGKQELHTSVYSAAGLVVADSKAQCFEFGDIAFVGAVFCSRAQCSQLLLLVRACRHGLKAGTLAKNDVVELGDVCKRPELQRKAQHDDRITVFDSTGVAVQDVAIACMVMRSLASPRSKL